MTSAARAVGRELSQSSTTLATQKRVMQKTVGAGNKKEFVRMRSADKAGVAAAQPDQEIEADPQNGGRGLLVSFE